MKSLGDSLIDSYLPQESPKYGGDPQPTHSASRRTHTHLYNLTPTQRVKRCSGKAMELLRRGGKVDGLGVVLVVVDPFHF